jgi:hypothetical protein
MGESSGGSRIGKERIMWNTPMFSRRHYKAIAGILSTTKADEEVIKLFEEFLKLDNPKFKKDLFRSACVPTHAATFRKLAADMDLGIKEDNN